MNATGGDQERVVPLYLVTQGRTRSTGRDLPWESMLTTTDQGRAVLNNLQFERARVVRLCQRPVSIAEVAAELGVPLGVARVLVSDLNAEGLLTLHVPQVHVNGHPRVEILQRLVAALRPKD